jgi:transposase
MWTREQLQALLKTHPEALVDLALELQALQTQLDAKDTRIRTLEEHLKELEGYVFGRHHKSQSPAKKPGAKAGHPGWFRSKPTEVHRTEEVALNACPNCGSKDLSLCAEVEDHVQEDIVLAEPQVTLYRKHVYWCKRCGKKVRGKGKDELPGSPIGPLTKSIADFLRYKVKVVQRDIATVLKELFRMSVSEAAVQGFHTQTRRHAQPVYDQLRDGLKKEPAVHADETGAPINGSNGWTWLFASKRIALYYTHPSRGGKVVQEVLGKTYDGILSTDFYSGYNRSIQAKAKQKCLEHLDRDLEKLLVKFPAGNPVFAWAKRVRNFFQEARALYDAYRAGTLTRDQLDREAARFKQELSTFIELQSKESDIRRLSKRLTKHQNELLTFLDYPDLVSPDNNYAERLIRSCVIFRKLTGGFRSKTGTDNHNVLMSLQQTAHLNGKDPLTLFSHVLTAKPNTLSLDCCLSP